MIFFISSCIKYFLSAVCGLGAKPFSLLLASAFISSTIKYSKKRMRDTEEHRLAYKFKYRCLAQREKRKGEWGSSFFGDSRGKSLV